MRSETPARISWVQAIRDRWPRRHRPDLYPGLARIEATIDRSGGPRRWPVVLGVLAVWGAAFGLVWAVGSAWGALLVLGPLTLGALWAESWSRDWRPEPVPEVRPPWLETNLMLVGVGGVTLAATGALGAGLAGVEAMLATWPLAVAIPVTVLGGLLLLAGSLVGSVGLLIALTSLPEVAWKWWQVWRRWRAYRAWVRQGQALRGRVQALRATLRAYESATAATPADVRTSAEPVAPAALARPTRAERGGGREAMRQAADRVWRGWRLRWGLVVGLLTVVSLVVLWRELPRYTAVSSRSGVVVLDRWTGQSWLLAGNQRIPIQTDAERLEAEVEAARRAEARGAAPTDEGHDPWAMRPSAASIPPTEWSTRDTVVTGLVAVCVVAVGLALVVAWPRGFRARRRLAWRGDDLPGPLATGARSDVPLHSVEGAGAADPPETSGAPPAAPTAGAVADLVADEGLRARADPPTPHDACEPSRPVWQRRVITGLEIVAVLGLLALGPLRLGVIGEGLKWLAIVAILDRWRRRWRAGRRLATGGGATLERPGG